MTRFIAVASGKGGTGKTTTSINLGIALKNLGREVILVDGNITQPNVSLYLGYPSNLCGLSDVLLGNKTINDSIYLHPSGMGFVPSNGALRIDGDFSYGLGEAMLKLVGKADFVIADAGAGLGHDVKSVLRNADETLIVTNPDHVSLNEAARTADLAEELGCVVSGIILNKVTGEGHNIPLSQVKEIIPRPIISIIPDDKNVRKSMLMRNPVVITHPHTHASLEFKKLARLIDHE